MLAAESGEEVIERVFVGHVNRSHARPPHLLVASEEIVVAQCHVEEAPWLDARRVVVVVLGA